MFRPAGAALCWIQGALSFVVVTTVFPVLLRTPLSVEKALVIGSLCGVLVVFTSVVLVAVGRLLFGH